MECHYQSWVSLVSQDNSTDRQADRVSWDSQNSSMDRRADRVSRVGNMKQNTGGSSKVANTESRVMENLANTESRLTENLAITESEVTQSLTNTESRVTKNSANMENWVMQDSGGGRKSEEGKGAATSKRLAPWWCPRGITKTQKCRMQKMRQRELAEKKEEEEQDYWFNCLWPMTEPKQMLWENG
jgi:hypothetical protein